jgi:hypothetical protein
MTLLDFGEFALAAVGAFILLSGLSYGSQRSVMRVGDLHVVDEEQRAVPAWVRGVAMVGALHW